MSGSPARAVDLYVSPSGNDTNAGSAKLPLASLAKARDTIRGLRKRGPLNEPVNVLVADGTYRLTEPLLLTSQDSGTTNSPVTYQAAAGAHPVFTGGKTLSGWQAEGSGLWKLRIPDVASGKWYFEQLFVNGRRAVRARTPNKSFLHPKVVREAAVGSGNKFRRTLIMGKPEDFPSALTRITPREVKDVNLVVYHNWDCTRRLLDSVDASKASLISSGVPMAAENPWTRASLFYLENYRDALDAPGEWFLARDGWLFYKPLPGEKPTTTTAIAPFVDKFLVLQGSADQISLVQNVTFRGLTFEHSQFPAGEAEPSQAAATIDAVVMADAARNIIIEDCEIRSIGTYAVWFRQRCQNCIVRRCYIHDLGAGGVRVGPNAIPGAESYRTSLITVDNNIIRTGGRVYPCAVGVWVGQSGKNKISHNEVADFFHSGISVGWQWGYKPSIATQNTIEFNHVHHLGGGILNDIGGIYTLGPSEGTVVRNNVVHDVYSYTYGGWGLFTDEGSSSILFENNLVYRTKTGAYSHNYGKFITVRNNILAFGKLYQLQAERAENTFSFSLDNNIIYFDSGVLMSGPWDRIMFSSKKNCYWRTDGQPIDFLGQSLQQWQEKGRELDSVIADPKFVSAATGDFHLRQDSPAPKVGFKPFNYEQAGVYGDPLWIQKAVRMTYPALVNLPEPPAMFDEDFEDCALGKAPDGAEIHVENRGDAIVVTNEVAAAGKQCLKIVDAPGLRDVYDPHCVYQGITCPEGQVHGSFDLQIDKGTAFQNEWREYRGAAYKTGPNFTVRDGKLQLNAWTSMDLPIGKWIHFDITARTDNKRWSLKVTVPGQPTRVFNDLSFGSADFRKLTWIGFISNATQKTTFYIDNLKLN